MSYVQQRMATIEGEIKDGFVAFQRGLGDWPKFASQMAFAVLGHKAWTQLGGGPGYAYFTSARLFNAHTYSFQTSV